MPQCELSRDSEGALSAFSVLVYFALIDYILLLNTPKKSNKKNIVIVFGLFFLTAPMAMVAINRDSQTQRNYWRFYGKVTDKFISNNHNSKSLVISGKEYEFIPNRIWNAAVIGSNIKKKVCGNITLNGEEFVFN